MSPITPHPTSPSALGQPSSVQSSPSHSQPQDRRTSMEQNSRRSSAQSVKQVLMSRSRSNSVASRPGSRAASQVTVTDQHIVAVPSDLSNFNPDEWLNDPTLDLGVDFNFSTMDGAGDGQAFDNNAFGNTVGNLNEFAPCPPNGAHYPQYPAYDNNMQSFHPDWMDGNVDPSLLSQQPYSLGDVTPGLTALPGASDQVSQFPMQYADPSMVMQPLQPYFHDAAHVQTCFTPLEAPAIQQAPQEAPVPAHQSTKRSLSVSDSETDRPASKRRRAAQPSDDEGPSPNIFKPSRRQSRDSEFSSESSLGNFKQPVIARAGETPQTDPSRPWVRINGNTKGETTRTARINASAAQGLSQKYKCKRLPNGDHWKSRMYTFEYTNAGGLHEFAEKKMSARQITEYITQYPTDDLRLWIQVAPADVARRYASPAHSKCLFEDCPKHTWNDSGTIDVGHYRVAFDEKFKVYGHNNRIVDPFDCPGFVHLYCLERFCDFERICQIADVVVDKRSDLPREISTAKWTMSGRPEAKTAHAFIKACKGDRLRDMAQFAQYPVHQSSHKPKVFDGTLVSVLAKINIDARTRSQMRQFIDRKLTPNVLMINRGDMEVAMTQKKIKHSKVYRNAIKSKRATAADFDFEALYDEYDPIINERIREYRALKAQYDAEDAAGTGASRHRSKATSKRKRAAAQHDNSDSESDDDAGHRGAPLRNHHHHRRHAHDDDDDSDQESPVAAHAPRHGTRSSPRKRPRINYADPDDLAYPQVPPEPAYVPHGYKPASPARRVSLSQYFPNIRTDDPTYDAERREEERRAEEQQKYSAADVDRQMEMMYNGELQRRKSSNLSGHSRFYAGVSKRSDRQASFAAQPVSQEQEYHVNDPPSQLVATPSQASPARRSERLRR